MKGKSDNTVIIVIAILAIAVYSGVLNFGGQTQAITGNAAVPSDFQCSERTYTVPIQTPNKLATTASLYSAADLALFGSDGALVVTGTSVSNSAYTSNSVPCSPTAVKGNAYVISGTSGKTNSASKPYDLTTFTDQQLSIPVSNMSQLTMAMYNTAYVNLTDGPTTSNTANESAATTVGSGETRTVNLQVKATTANAQFGSDDGGLIWAVDTVDSTVFSDMAVSLSSTNVQLVSVECSARVASYASANRCYKSPAIKASDGLLTVSITQTADLGNPGATADPKIYVIDVQHFEEDNALKTDGFNKAGSDVGTSNQVITLNNA